MKRPLIYSAALHAIVLILLTVGLWDPFPKKNILNEQPMMVEFVQIAELSAAPQLAPQVIQNTEPTPEPPKPPPPQPDPKPEPAPQPDPEPVKPEPLPEPKPEPKPEPAKPDPIPEAEPIPDPKAKEKPKPEKPKEEPKKIKAEINLDKKKKSEAKSDEKSKKKKNAENFDALLDKLLSEDDGKPTKGKGAPAETIGAVVTANEIDAIRQRIYKCWIVPAGIRGARDMVVDIDIHTDRDGTVKKASIVHSARMNSDPAFKSAAESAKRAVLDPRCNPLPIPPEKYEQFKNFTFGFNPKDMF